MSPNPLDDVSRGLQVIRDRVRQTAGADPVDWVADQLRTLVAFLQVQSRRLEHGLPEVATSQHLVFRGNPGTGKTTIARLLAQMYRSMGLLEKGQLVEVDRA